MLTKDSVVELSIEDISTGGEGIGKVEGYTLFVKDAIIGDVIEAKVIKAKKNYGYGRLLNIIKPSPFRVEPRCEVARQCGGCQLQQMDYQAQLDFKYNLVKNNLERIGGIDTGKIELLPTIGMDEPYRYRNKAQFPVGKNKDGEIVMGFYAGRTHYIVHNTDCCIGAKINKTILDIIRTYMKENGVEPYNETSHTGCVRHILIRTGHYTGQIMVCIIVNSKKDNCLKNVDRLIGALAKIENMTSIMLNKNTEKTNVILGKENVRLWGEPFIEDYIGDIKFRISAQSFFQVNPVQTGVLYSKALEFADLSGNENVWDLYCGIGTISLFLAKKAKKVYGVEIVPQAIADAKENARINGIENVEFFVGKAEEVVPSIYNNALSDDKSGGNSADAPLDKDISIKPDVVVVDPPRKGCDEVLLDTIIKMSPKRIVYVSCDSATLARDLKYLAANGYEIKKVQPVDQFGHSVHVETVCLLSKEL